MNIDFLDAFHTQSVALHFKHCKERPSISPTQYNRRDNCATLSSTAAGTSYKM
jgi:hypothetical protein